MLKERKGQIFAFGVVIALLLFFGFGLKMKGAGRPTAGAEAPPFTLSLFDGEQLSLQELRGQVVVLNFWASWCGPCWDEQPFFEETWREYKDDGVVFVGVDYLDTPNEAQDYLEQFDVTYPNGPDKGTDIALKYQIRGVPETFIIDGEGRVAEVFPGPVSSKSQLTTVLDSLLRGEP